MPIKIHFNKYIIHKFEFLFGGIVSVVVLAITVVGTPQHDNGFVQQP